MRKLGKPPRKAKKKTDIWENLGKVFMNFGQVIFGTLFLGSVLRGGVPQYIMMTAGFIGTTFFVTIGLLLSAKELKGEEEQYV